MTHRGENENVARAAGIVGMATMLSRIFGFIRDMVVAAFFGAGIATDAFFVAFRIPNLLRRLLGEGSLTVAFIPVFTEYLKTKSRESALELASIALTFLSIVLVLVSMAGVLLSPLVVSLMAPGFLKNPEQFDLAVFLTRIMFPYIFFISLVALCMGILNSLRHFAAPALAPVVLNISMILTTLLLHRSFEQPITALAVGVMLGGALQLAMQWPVMIRMGAILKPNFHFRHPGMKRIGRLLIPTLVGSGIYQINIFIGTILASILPKGSVSFLYYADRVVELPLGVFAIAVGTASLPSLSAQVAKGLFEDFKKTISFSLRLILFITIPATIALIALREPIVSVLFQRGAFDAYSTRMTAQALLFYTVGLWAFSVIRVIDSAFFSLQDRKSPLKAAAVSLIVNVGLSVLLMFPLKHGGLALATSAASAVNVLMLSYILWKKIGTFLDTQFYSSVAKACVASVVMAVSFYLVTLFFPWNIEAPFDARVLFLSTSIAAGILTFFGTSFLLKSDEMVALLNVIRRKLKS
ncbi:MAG: putative peptidoglycan biosynthesis protein MurJ [Syntrophus sp. PtaU1.Bin005]|jgi:putative peptidoglycan lipid II flippase|uniref:murein biosynthesis integral membrane protein MurJ n=1 Tax=Syntrophus sp. (in: bacteria) TaxID=48412 RepID=UPI0009CF9B9C|nr:MAG: putative peptidoglycan biosynthesis protein MurJ [Syntrophus sp. PtaU1.Bin005]